MDTQKKLITRGKFLRVFLLARVPLADQMDKTSPGHFIFKENNV